MGVKLDWDIEAEKGKHKEHREDRRLRVARRVGVVRLIIAVVIVTALLGAVIYVVYQRWQQVNQRVEQLLVDTVQAEVAALRLGDVTAFEERQRSASEDWLTAQRQTYNDYQTLKVESDVILTGNVLSVEVENQRGRVQVEEIIDGVPYVQTWFYWRYDDGWLHAPPDYTFWGEAATIETDRYVIRYNAIDEQTASSLNASLSDWLSEVCGVFPCDTLPPMTFDIVPAPGITVRWAQNTPEAWQLLIASPYTGRARADRPLSTEMQIEIGTSLSRQLVAHLSGGMVPQPASDASFLHNTVTAWLVGRFARINPETHLLDSLVANYGEATIASLLTNLQPASGISILASITGSPSVAEMSLDWRDFVHWRLELEDSLIQGRDQASWSALYDFSDPAVQDAANQRYLNSFVASNRTILDVTRAVSSAGVPQLVARVAVTRGFESGEEIVVFNFINGNWLRTN